MAFDHFGSAALVVAHPDDEVLWFSSVVGKVSRVIIAYEGCADLPELEQARHAASEKYPLPTAVFLRRPEPCSLGHVDWAASEPTEYGMALNRDDSGVAEQRYRTAYEALRRDLEGLLVGMSDVFTHNPWGEYGHPDHVLVSKLVTALGAQLQFRAHFSNYISPRSMRFGSQFIPGLSKGLVLPSDRSLGEQLKTVYVEHGCWTWHADYAAPEIETFLTGTEEPQTEADSLPLTCLMTE